MDGYLGKQQQQKKKTHEIFSHKSTFFVYDYTK